MPTTRTKCFCCGKSELFNSDEPPSIPDQKIRLLYYHPTNALDAMFCDWQCLQIWLSKKNPMGLKQLGQTTIDV